MGGCRTCELVEQRAAGGRPVWDDIVRTPGWDVVHAFGTSIEGWTCVIVRRHVAAVADLTDDEAAELGPLLVAVSKALHELLGCEKTYVVQFAEAPGHQHVHVHVVPRAVDLADDRQGPRVFAALGVPPEDEVPEARRDEIAAALRARLSRRR